MTLNDYFSFFQPSLSIRNCIFLNFLCAFSFFSFLDKLSFHATFALSTLVALSEYDGDPHAQCVTHAKRVSFLDQPSLF